METIHKFKGPVVTYSPLRCQY